jgi:hypothetical protein
MKAHRSGNSAHIFSLADDFLQRRLQNGGEKSGLANSGAELFGCQ